MNSTFPLRDLRYSFPHREQIRSWTLCLLGIHSYRWKWNMGNIASICYYCGKEG